MRLKRKHFKYQQELRYYSFKDPGNGIEIALEPCMNGFDVAIYTLGSEQLIWDKVCTDDDQLGYSQHDPFWMQSEMNGSRPNERPQRIWSKALEQANKFYQSFLNYKQVHIMGLKERKDNEDWLPLTGKNTEIHGTCPKGRI